ncbi:hypothetical protein RND81_08G222000 [Saponaria officinalis]|uniref:Uncharacterized protein n=1 Tax=Saponaria officinalis TaxID=3572 RepID=A0AAW1JAY3_SAPOF
MASFTCFAYPQIIPKIQCRSLMYRHQNFGTALNDSSFVPEVEKRVLSRTRFGVCHSSMSSSEIASSVFTLGTAAVLPFYTLMLAAPKADLLEGIAKMFSNEMSLASAWIHLLVVDLYAARQVYEDGVENEVEIRHSVALCLLFCPIGIISHAITKQLSNTPETTKHNDTLI